MKNILNSFTFWFLAMMLASTMTVAGCQPGLPPAPPADTLPTPVGAMPTPQGGANTDPNAPKKESGSDNK